MERLRDAPLLSADRNCKFGVTAPLLQTSGWLAAHHAARLKAKCLYFCSEGKGIYFVLLRYNIITSNFFVADRKGGVYQGRTFFLLYIF
jgi:hypothetical protein